jgi:hypothetical protein
MKVISCAFLSLKKRELRRIKGITKIMAKIKTKIP